MTKQFDQIILCAADSVQELRRSDVDRVVNEANEQNLLMPFVQWLGDARPELGVDIGHSLAGIGEAIAEWAYRR